MPVTLQFLVATLLVALTIRGMRRRAADPAPGRASRAAAVLGLFAYFSVAGAVLLGLVGLWRVQTMNGIEARWSSLEVAVVRCQVVHRDSPPGVNDYNYYGAECRFRAAAEDDPAEMAWDGCCTTEGRVREWLRPYAAGTRHRLYRRGERTSLGWAAGPIIYDSPHRSAREMLWFAVVGWLTWFAARRLERQAD